MSELVILISTAVALGFVHTIVGPDHYVPFIAISKSRNWSNPKVLGIVSLCGLGHILSSVIIGLIGIALGITISSIEIFESSRGEIAGWLLIGFGFVYMLWGIKNLSETSPTPTYIYIQTAEVIFTNIHTKKNTSIFTLQKRKI